MMRAIRYLIVALCVLVHPQVYANDVAVAGITFPGTITDEQWDVFKANVAEGADPPLDLKMMIRGEAGSEELMVQALRRGRLQLAAPSLAGATSLVPELAVLQLPFLFESTEQMDFIYDKVLPTYFQSAFEQRGLVFLHWIDSGWLGFYGPASYANPASVEAVKLRTAPTDAARLIAEAINADAIYVPYTEIVPALQTGLIEGGMTSDYAFVTGGLAEETKVFTLTRHSYDTGMMLANAPWYASLSETNKRLFTTAYGSTSDFRARSRAYSRRELQILSGRSGTQVVELTPEQRSTWTHVTAGTHSTLLDRVGQPAVALYTLIKDAKAQFNAE